MTKGHIWIVKFVFIKLKLFFIGKKTLFYNKKGVDLIKMK